MREKYILGRDNIEFNLQEKFPKLSSGKNIAVFTSGGMESTLLAKMCFEIYGRDRTILCYSDTIFDGQEEHTHNAILGNVKNIEKVFGKEIEYIPFDLQLHTENLDQSIINTQKYCAQKYNIETSVWGFTKLFWSIADLKQPGATAENSRNMCLERPDLYLDVIEEYHQHIGAWSQYLIDVDMPPNLWPSMEKVRDIIVCPFEDINKKEVVELYKELHCIDLLHQTRSCVSQNQETSGYHCGACFNCQQRHDGFVLAGEEDPTIYNSGLVIENRKKTTPIFEEYLENLKRS